MQSCTLLGGYILLIVRTVDLCSDIFSSFFPDHFSCHSYALIMPAHACVFHSIVKNE